MQTDTLHHSAPATEKGNWKPLLPSALQQDALDMAILIANSIMESGPEERGISLTQEDAGLIIFFQYLSRITEKQEYADYAEQLLQDCVKTIGEAHCKYNFADGIAGFSWMVNHLSKEGFFKEDMDEFLGDVDDFMIQCLEHDLERRNFDFFWGAAGVVTYLLSRSHIPAVAETIHSYLNFLDEHFCHPELDKIWARETINLTFAHGLPAVFSNVLTALKKGIMPEKARSILQNGIDFILATRLDPTQFGSHFGFILTEGNEPQGSRVGWCQGDLIMGQFLIRAGQALGDKTLENTGVEVLKHTANRRQHNESQVVDASFCHGTAGNMHMFARAWHLSDEPTFKETANFWYNENLKHARYIDGRLEFHPLMGGEHTDFFKDDGLTMGSSGVGLCLLAAATDQAPNWDEAFLLS